MVRIHRTKKGRLEPCGATLRACPLGEQNHYDTAADAARAAFEQRDAVTAPSHAQRLVKRENALLDASRVEVVPVATAHRRIADVREIYFSENGRETGNGVRVTRLRNGDSFVRLPLLAKLSDGEYRNVSLWVPDGASVRKAWETFLMGVEDLPPDTYRIVGNEDGHEVVSELSTEHYARMRAALRASETLLDEPLPEPKGTANRELLDELTALRSA